MSTTTILTPQQFGAIGNGVADDTSALQAMIDAAVKTNGEIELGRAKYRFTKTLRIGHANFAFFTIRMSGKYQFCGQEVTQFIYDSKEGAAINIQHGKGVIIEGIHFIGKYTVPKLDIYRTAWDDYNDPTITDERYNPYAAIVIDGKQKPGATNGSTGITISNCSFINFVGAINLSPNGKSLNNELNLIEHCAGRNLKYFFSGGQAQEKMNILYRLKLWDNIHTCFVFSRYGSGNPGDYIIEKVNIAGKVGNLIHRYSQLFFTVKIKEVFAETLGSIGVWNTSLQDKLEDALIHFAYPQHAGLQIHLTGNGVVFRDCTFRHYGMNNIPFVFKGQVKFDNCYQNTNPIRGLRYAVTDLSYQNGFLIDPVYNYTDVQVENNTVNITGEFAIGDIVVFMLGNYDYAGTGQVTNVVKGIATVSYVNILSGKYRVGKYRSK